MLNIFGPKGSDKTELAETLMSFFMTGNEPQNIETSTLPALADCMAGVSNALVHIYEYKNGIDIKKAEWLKDLWGAIGRSRMNMDKDKKREQARVAVLNPWRRAAVDGRLSFSLCCTYKMKPV